MKRDSTFETQNFPVPYKTSLKRRLLLKKTVWFQFVLLISTPSSTSALKTFGYDHGVQLSTSGLDLLLGQRANPGSQTATELAENEAASQATPSLADDFERRWDQTDKSSTLDAQLRPTRSSAIDQDSANLSPSDSIQTQQYEFMQQDGLQVDGLNLLDLIEPGSGLGPPARVQDEASSMFGPALVIQPTSSLVEAGQLFTPTFSPPSLPSNDDKPPVLVRRLPRLFGSAGSPWRLKLPSGTFQDEDGDLRHLRSTLVPKQFTKMNEEQRDDAAQQLKWLQYDQASQTLYGFPTDKDVGLNVYQLLVSDRWNSISNETIRIDIKPHQSSRAVTHLITIDGIEIANAHQISVPNLLADLTKSVAERVLADRTGKSMIIQSYTLLNATPSDDADLVSPNELGLSRAPKSILSVSWFNSSLPIHLCDPSGLEAILRALVDERQLTPDWSLLNRAELNAELRPSAALIRALEPNLRPSSVQMKLLGACESNRNRAASSRISVTSRLGRLQWKLGQPIIYQIPSQMFLADGGQRSTRNLSLTLHTIDGKTLDQDPAYKFLDFDQATQTVFGLAVDVAKHVGQRELLLTARHPVTDERTRETFLIDIEAQDLTTINNRAFRVSLYFMTPLNSFGPREQVQLSQQIVSALDAHQSPSWPAQQWRSLNEATDFIVIGIQKFTTGSYIDNSATLSDPSNTWKFQDKIVHIHDEAPPSGSSWPEQTGADQAASGNSLIYKLSWTNETIGHGGDCPVEVIKEDILQALSEIDYNPSQEDTSKNESVRFYERLRGYFEPAIDLVHLRFEPTSACVDALELHDVGNSDIADIVDNAEAHETETTETPLANILAKSLETSTPKAKPPGSSMSPINSDEYWAIVVLIILVVAIFFVVMMLIMGLHTYRINQDKRFELQMRLAQARQNSIYLSSMMLSDQAQANDLLLNQNYSNNQQQVSAGNKVAFVNERISRKPAILDQEKQLLASQAAYFKQPTSVQLSGQSVKTLPLNRNATFTMDSISSQAYPQYATGVVGQQQRLVFVPDQPRRSMTLNRRADPSRGLPPRQASVASHLSHSQSIITVASMAPNQFGPKQPQVVYAPLPVPYEPIAEMPFDI